MIYSVLDLETTGFSPNRGDRIVEIGIYKIDSTGTVIDQFESLVNPKRDVGPTHIHGITAEMVINAPTSEQIEEQVMAMLSDSIIVGHNISFDLRFIQAEFPMLSAEYESKIPAICTMQLSKTYLHELPNFKLDSLCSYYNIDNQYAHSALSDAKSTALAFLELLYENNLYEDFNPDIFQLTHFPESCNNCLGLSREAFYQAKKKDKSPLHKMIASLPKKKGKPINEIEYLELIDRVLLDRLIVDNEIEQLQIAAHKLNISQAHIIELHLQYLKSLIIRYLADGIISKAEEKDLLIVRNLLALDSYDLEPLIESVQQTPDSTIAEYQNKDLIGCSVCFTGEFQSTLNGKRISRALAESIAKEHEMITKKGITKSLDYLVIADPNSQSYKARKAREYGVCIVTEKVFWSLMGININ